MSDEKVVKKRRDVVSMLKVFLENKGVHPFLVELWEKHQILILYKKANKKLWLVFKDNELFWVDKDELTSLFNRILFKLFAMMNIQVNLKDFFEKVLKQNLIENEWKLVYEFEDWRLKVVDGLLYVNGVYVKRKENGYDKRIVKIAEKFINNLVSDDVEKEALQLWLYWMFKYPNKKSQKILALVGERGTGKTTFTIAISNALRKKFEVLDGEIVSKIAPKTLRSDFNDYMLSKLIIVEEATTKNREIVEKLKDFATTDFVTINQKFKPPKLVVNKSEFIFTANEFTLPIESTLKERRWIIVKTKPYNLAEVLSYDEFEMIVKGEWVFDYIEWLEEKFDGVNIFERLNEIVFNLKHKKELIMEAKTNEKTIAAKVMKAIDLMTEAGLEVEKVENGVMVGIEEMYKHASLIEVKNERERWIEDLGPLNPHTLRELLRQIRKGFHSDVFKIVKDEEEKEWLVIDREFWDYVMEEKERHMT
jgi:DNA polymerase III delta prime subunit